MKKIAGLEVSNAIFKLIEDSVLVDNEAPYLFAIYGVNCYGGAYNNANTRLEKIKKWAEKRGAEVTVIDRPLAHKIMVEITDPVAAYLEKHLVTIH